MENAFHFQVNLGGMLDILSNHLYKSPDVFLRELLQNAVDAITQRKILQPSWNEGEIVISLNHGTMAFTDNGSGLTEEGIHQFLAVIGQSSKTDLINGTFQQGIEDYIGRFGIGLLSCFMVSDSITVHTRHISDKRGYIWTGLPDGTYTLNPAPPEGDFPVGTTVILKAKPGTEKYYTYEQVEHLIQYYGLALPVPIRFQGQRDKINQIPENFVQTSQTQLLGFGSWVFGTNFLDVIPIHTKHLDGAAFILPYETSSVVKGGHRIYLKQMLLTESGDRLLPSWAFFLQCFLNTTGLRPTASREDFYEDEALEQAQREFTLEVSQYLNRLSQQEPELLRKIVHIHFQAFKTIAVWDEDMFRLIFPYLPFQSNKGEITGEKLLKTGGFPYVADLNKFRQLKSVFLSQGKILLCAGYTNDEELFQKMHYIYRFPAFPLKEQDLYDALQEPTLDQRDAASWLVRIAGQSLEKFQCGAEIKQFLPVELPALYITNDDDGVFRKIQNAKQTANEFYSDIMSSMLDSIDGRNVATLFLNMNCRLIKKLCSQKDADKVKSVIRILYVQALLSGGFPLQERELRMMGRELLNLVGEDSYDF